ncbi:MAG: type IV pilus secretin PilQ [Pseudomonadota bacterium]
MVKYGGRHVVISLALVLVFLLTGCATPQQAAKPTAAVALASQSQLRVVSDIVTTEDDTFVSVLISGDQALTYTSVKQPYPPAVVLYLPSTRLQNISASMPVDSTLIESIKASEIVGSSTTSRIEIKLKVDTEYAVSRQGNELKIVFDKPALIAPEASQDTAIEAQSAQEALAPVQSEVLAPAGAVLMPATAFAGASAIAHDDEVSIKFSANGAIREYDAFTIKNPARIVFDIYGIDSPYKGEQIVPVNTEAVKKIRHFKYPDKVRVVIDTEDAFLDQFQANTVEDGLVVTVGAKSERMAPVAQVTVTVPPVEQVSAAAAAPAPKRSGEPAWVNRIDFSSEKDGKSTIIVGTTQSVKYVMNTDGDQKLLLTLFDTNLPGYRQRPLITTRFESAIDRISPIQTATMKDKSLITIELREAVPYTIEQLDDLIMIHFDPSSVPPRPLEQAGLPDWQKAIDQAAMAASVPAAAAAPEMATKGSSPDPALANVTVPEDTGAYDEKRTYYRTTDRKYTGEKIALDFYETDVKNVFRILREISGKNYAIDKDVAGKVTLSLDKPVPWDQVLDLVLRMNQLGMVYEGDIVRVATLATIKQEEQLRSEALKQAIDAKANERALAPLETGYYPINYADASRDILPHVQTIITPDRGKVSVYTPTNQLIVVDTREVQNAVGEMIKELDRVTDQVLIEARVVQATTNFAREFGTEFAGTTPSTGGLSLPGKMSGDVGMNFATSGLQGGSKAATFALDYIKVAGTPLTIAAKLNLYESQGETKTISAPKILTLDNKPATIKQGTSYPINKLDADGNSTTEFKDIVLELTVTPHVTKDGRISMKISVTKNDLGDQVGSNFKFTINEANTELIVNDGDTIVIAGITVTQDKKGETGVPGLKDIPLLGWLFKTESTTNDKNELLIFLNPQIVKLPK